jgi:anthranilate synthase/aminodeoxychorismate synthase-like glutamine amidotransferase
VESGPAVILLIDNYDSFTYNLYHYLGELGAEVMVVRNDELSVEEVARLEPEKIVISPGPCTPREAGISCEVIRTLGVHTPVLGVCLGHQCIGAAFGGEIVRAPSIMHGKLSEILHDGLTIFRSLKNPFAAMRYHSLVIDPRSLPEELIVSARTPDRVIMGVRHKRYPIEGVQFHPESILSEEGKRLLQNFLDYYRKAGAARAG